MLKLNQLWSKIPLIKKANDGVGKAEDRKKTIKLQFQHFWKGFDYKEHFGFLDDYYDIKLSNNPDYIIYSCYGSPWNGKVMPELKSKATRIFYTGENVRPDMDKCDYAISFCYEDDIKNLRHFRIPNYTLRLWKFGYSWKSLEKQNINSQDTFQDEKNFCNFIYSNPNCKIRNDFFHELSNYKKVDAGGKLFNNIGSVIPGNAGDVGNKIDFMKSYKFSIAFENSSYPGYTTEKLVEAVISGTIPIYWGNPLVNRDFNTKSFISFYDCGGTLESLRKKVEEVDKNTDLYLSYLQEPFLHENKSSKYLSKEYVRSIFKTIFG